MIRTNQSRGFLEGHIVYVAVEVRNAMLHRCDMCNMCSVNKMAALKSAEINPHFFTFGTLKEYNKPIKV